MAQTEDSRKSVPCIITLTDNEIDKLDFLVEKTHQSRDSIIRHAINTFEILMRWQD